MRYLTILDYSDGVVSQYDMVKHFTEKPLSSLKLDDIEEFIESKGYRIKDIEWMSHTNPTIKYDE